MFNKRFLTLALIVVLALVLGIGVLAQDDDTNLSHHESPLTSLIQTLRSKLDFAEKDDSLPFLAKFDSLIEEMDAQSLSLFANEEHPTSLNKTQLQEIRGLVGQWADTLQKWQNVGHMPFARWFNRMADPLNKLFEKIQPDLSLSDLFDAPIFQELNSFKMAK